jgi:hypothetical protein
VRRENFGWGGCLPAGPLETDDGAHTVQRSFFTRETRLTNGTHSAPASSHAQATAAENLRFAIGDHQEIIRGTDIKAEVMAVLIGGVLTVLTLEAGISTTSWYGWLGVISVLTALCALWFVGLVLWPRSNPWRALPMGGYTPTQVLYPPGKLGPQDTVASRTAAALSTDWGSELTYELLKLASIRAAKQLWYRWALATSGASIVAAAVRLFLPHS